MSDVDRQLERYGVALDCIKRSYALLVRYENAREGLPVAWRDAFRYLNPDQVPPAARESQRALDAEMERLVGRVNGVPCFVAGVTDSHLHQLFITYQYVAGIALLSLSYWLTLHDPVGEAFRRSLAEWLPFGTAPHPEPLTTWTPDGQAS